MLCLFERLLFFHAHILLKERLNSLELLLLKTYDKLPFHHPLVCVISFATIHFASKLFLVVATGTIQQNLCATTM